MSLQQSYLGTYIHMLHTVCMHIYTRIHPCTCCRSQYAWMRRMERKCQSQQCEVVCLSERMLSGGCNNCFAGPGQANFGPKQPLPVHMGVSVGMPVRNSRKYFLICFTSCILQHSCLTAPWAPLAKHMCTRDNFHCWEHLEISKERF